MTGFDTVILAAVAGMWTVCGLAIAVVLVRAYRRPENDTDRRCAAVDRELTERERYADRDLGRWR